MRCLGPHSAFKEFIECDPNTDHFKTRFKLIPKIIEGNFMIRKTVPSKPALLANKGLTVPFHRDDHYFEVDVDITSDSTARFITKMALGVRQLRHHFGPLLTHFSAHTTPHACDILYLAPMLIGC